MAPRHFLLIQGLTKNLTGFKKQEGNMEGTWREQKIYKITIRQQIKNILHIQDI